MRTNQQLSFEPLEARRLTAADLLLNPGLDSSQTFTPPNNRYLSSLTEGVWHNRTLPGDVDTSGFVDPLDVLHVINAVRRDGIRDLAAIAHSTESNYVDVDDNGWLTPMDVLVVINLLNRALPELSVVFNPSPASDPNSNGLVMIDQVELRGQTEARATIDLQLQSTIGESFFAGQTQADDRGMFHFDVAIPLGATNVQVKVADQLGRFVEIERQLRRGDMVADWNAAVLNVIRDWTTVSNDPYQGRIVPSQPPRVAKNLAMIHTALFDAMNAVHGQYGSYLQNLPHDDEASPVAAGAAAAHQVASALYQDADELAVWNATLAESLATIPDDNARARGIVLGRAVGDAMLAARANDGSSSTSKYQTSDSPGHWNRTTPDFLPPLLAQWPAVKPFAISSAIDFRPGPPPLLDSEEYAQAVDEVMRLGGLNSQERTIEQTEIAIFWADGGGTATPPGHWNQIASEVGLSRSQSLLDSARTFALLNLAMADVGIAVWDTKYHYDLWRPVDAIRKGNSDGNPATIEDESWIPLLRTPPFPSYTSGHSAFSAAAATILTEIYGEDVTFTSRSDGHTGLTQRPIADQLIVTRSFASFNAAALEAGRSRIYGGIHYVFDNESGFETGQSVATFVLGQLLANRSS